MSSYNGLYQVGGGLSFSGRVTVVAYAVPAPGGFRVVLHEPMAGGQVAMLSCDAVEGGQSYSFQCESGGFTWSETPFNSSKAKMAGALVRSRTLK